MDEEKNSHLVQLTVNGKKITKIIISSHYQKNHSTYMNDELILKMVKNLDNKDFQPDDKKENPNREFFMLDNIDHRGKKYKLIWCSWTDHPSYLGIINCYRRK